MEGINISIEIYTNENNFNLHPEIAATVSKSVNPSTVNYE